MTTITKDVDVRDAYHLRVDGEIRAWGNRAALEAMVAENRIPAYWGENCGDTETDVLRECEDLEEQGIDTGMYRA